MYSCVIDRDTDIASAQVRKEEIHRVVGQQVCSWTRDTEEATRGAARQVVIDVLSMQLEPLAKLYCYFTPCSNDSSEQGVGRRALCIVFDGSVEVLELVVSEFCHDFAQQFDAGMVRECCKFFELAESVHC